MKETPSDATTVASLLNSPPNRSPSTSSDSLSVPVAEWTIIEGMVMRLMSPGVGSRTPTRPGSDEAGVGSPTTRWAGAAVPRVAPCSNDRRHWAACIPHRAMQCNTVGHAGNDQDDTAQDTPNESATGSTVRSRHAVCTTTGINGHLWHHVGVVLSLLTTTNRRHTPRAFIAVEGTSTAEITRARRRSRLGGPSPIGPGLLGRGT